MLHLLLHFYNCLFSNWYVMSIRYSFWNISSFGSMNILVPNKWLLSRFSMTSLNLSLTFTTMSAVISCAPSCPSTANQHHYLLKNLPIYIYGDNKALYISLYPSSFSCVQALFLIHQGCRHKSSFSIPLQSLEHLFFISHATQTFCLFLVFSLPQDSTFVLIIHLTSVYAHKLPFSRVNSKLVSNNYIFFKLSKKKFVV